MYDKTLYNRLGDGINVDADKGKMLNFEKIEEVQGIPLFDEVTA